MRFEEAVEAEHPRRLVDPLDALGPGELAGRLVGAVGVIAADEQRRLDVPLHRHVGVERVALEHHRHVAPGGVDVVDHLVADEELAVGDAFQPGDHPQGGGLAAARRPQQDHELTVVDRQVEGVDGDDVVEALGHVFRR